MTRHLFLTRRAQPLARWLEAFPEAGVSSSVMSGNSGGTLLWLHLESGDKQPAERVVAAAASAPSCIIVVLANEPNQAEGLACLEAGAAGYTSALATPDLLRQVASVVENGGLWVGPELMHRLRAALADKKAEVDTAGTLVELSPREREVAMAVASGATNKEVARAMGITERTVKAHLSAIFERLGVRDRMQLSILVNGGGTTGPQGYSIQ